jgi:hypothetical protein
MCDEKTIEAEFRKWWSNHNADSDDMPGDRNLAFQAFRAGYIKHAAHIAPPRLTETPEESDDASTFKFD